MDKLNNESPIMGNCLSCNGLVRVPSTAPTSSTVCCPHCDESFRLSQILNDAVPELKIVVEEEDESEEVDDDGSAKDADGRFVVANQLRQSSKKSRRGKRRSRSRRSEEAEGMVPVPKPLNLDLAIEPESADFAASGGMGAKQFSVSGSETPSTRESFDSRRSSGSGGRRSSSESSRSQSSSRDRSSTQSSGGGNAAFEIIKVVVGGALAIPIAYLLVLWVFKQDPLHVAPKIVQTVPFLVPAKFHDEVEEPSTDADSSGSSYDLGNFDGDELDSSGSSFVEEILDVSNGLPKPRRDPGKVGIN